MSKQTGSPAPTTRASSLLIALCLVGLALGLPAWWRLANQDQWATGARKIAWYDEEGQQIQGDPKDLYPWSGCDEHVDIKFQTLVFDGVIWTSCHTDEAPQGGFAYIDPERGEGRFFAVPKNLSHRFTVGLVPGPDGQLGVIYVANGLEGPLAVGTLSREGWVYTPREVAPNLDFTSFLGAAWVDDALEIALQPKAVYAYSPDPYSAFLVARLEGEKPQIRQRFKDRAQMCAASGHTSCSRANLALWRDGSWRFVVDTYGVDSISTWELDENGQASPISWVRKSSSLLDAAVDNTVHGIVDIGVYVLTRSEEALGVIQRDGSLAPLPKPASPTWEWGSAWKHFEVVEGVLRLRDLWTVPGEALTLARRVGEHWVALVSTYDAPDDHLVLLELREDGAEEQRRVIARAPGYACGDLVVGAFLPREEGGYWLVARDGCYIRLTSSFTRADPLDIFEHFRRRGSLGMDWDETWHIWKLGWLLFGLPVCLGLALLFALAWHRAIDRRSCKALSWAAGLFCASAGWVLLEVLPLMR